MGQVWEERSPRVMAPEADGWGRKQDDRAWRDGSRGQNVRHPPEIKKQQDRWKKKEKMRIRGGMC